MTAARQSLLELRDVEARYGEIRALHGVTLTVDEGDFVAVLGANGAGKTTMLRAISGTVKTTGDVLLDGAKLLRRTPEAMARRGVAHVPEGRGTFAALSVIPILFLVQLAFIVAFGVLLDTFIVRSLLVPALSYDIGRAIWWPSKLSRGEK